jgi:hypothetical protein
LSTAHVALQHCTHTVPVSWQSVFLEAVGLSSNSYDNSG